MDHFAEQLVKKQTTSFDELKKVLIIVGTVLLSLITLYLSFTSIPIAIVLPVGFIYLGIYLFRMSKVEYEYSCTNGTLDIDKILGQSKRVSMLSVEVSSFLAFGYEHEAEEVEGITTFSAVGISFKNSESVPLHYYADFDHEEHGRCRLLFSPEEKLIDAMTPFLPRKLRS